MDNYIKLKEKIGVCLDTCHLSDSGININEFDKYLDEFDKKIGIDKNSTVLNNKYMQSVVVYKKNIFLLIKNVKTI